MATAASPQFLIEKERKGVTGYKPVFLVELLGKDLVYATRDPGFTGTWKYGDGLLYGSSTEYGDSYPTYDTGLARLDSGGVSTISFQLDALGLARTGDAAVEILNQALANTNIGDVTNASIRIRLGFFGGDFSDYITIFSGNVDDFRANYERLSLELVDDTLRNLVPTPPQTGSDFFPQAVTVGASIPIVLGDVDGVPGIPLVSDVTAVSGQEFLAAATSLFILGTNHTFPRAGSVSVTNGAISETLTYDGVRSTINLNTPMLEFIGLTRTAPVTVPAGADVTLVSFDYQYITNFEGQDARRIRVDGTPASVSSSFQSIPLSPTGNDHRKVHTVKSVTEETGITVSMGGADRNPNLILNGEGNAAPVSHGWTSGGFGLIDTFEIASGAESAIRLSVIPAQPSPTTLFQDITTTPGKRYRLKATTKNVTAPFQTILVGTPASPSSVFSFGELRDTAIVDHDIIFRATEATTRVTLLADNTAAGSFTALFDNLVVYNVDSDNPATQIESLINRHIPSVKPDPVSFAEASAAYAVDFDRLNGVINETEEAQTLLGRIAYQFRAKTFLDECGFQKLKVFDNARNPVAFWTPDHVDKGSMQVYQESTEKIYTSVFVYFDRDPSVSEGDLGGREAYRGLLYATPEETNSLDDAALQVLCKNAKDQFRVERTLEIFADLIPDAATADRLLSYITRISVHRRVIAEFTSYLQAVTVEIGDFVKLEHPLLPVSANGVSYEVIGKEIIPNGCLTAWTLAEVRQAAFGSFVENWEPVNLLVPSQILLENWEPPPPLELADPGEVGNLICNPFIETWDPIVCVIDESFNYITSDDPTGPPINVTGVELTRAFSAGFDFETTPSTSTPLENIEVANASLTPVQLDPSRLIDTVKYQQRDVSLGLGSFNNDRFSGPGSFNSLRITTEEDAVPAGGGVNFYFKRYGSPQLRVAPSRGDREFTISVWARFEDLSRSQGIIVQGSDTFQGGAPLHSTDRIHYVLWYDNVLDRFKAGVSESVFNGSPGTYTTGQAYLDLFSNTVVANNLGSPAIDTWYHFILDWDPSTETVRIKVNNGVADSSVIAMNEWEWTPVLSNDFHPAFGAYDETFADFCRLGTYEFNRSLLTPTSATVDPPEMQGFVTLPYFWSRKLLDSEHTTIYAGGSGLSFTSF